VLIIVQVALDTMRKIEAHRTMSQYDTLGNEVSNGDCYPKT